jgi:hypothetical protein
VTRLEERYRRVLRLLPASYRLRWEEEMVEAFLTSVETYDPDRADFLGEFGRPSLGEVASVAALSLRLRLGLAGTPSPRSAAWGGAWRFVALAWLLANAALVATPMIGYLWAPPVLRWMADRVDAVVVDETAPTMLWHYAPVLWIAAFFALLLGRLRLARVLAVLLVAREVLTVVIDAGADLVAGASPLWLYSGPALLFDVGLLATLWAFPAGRAAAPRRGPWVLAFGGAVGVLSAHLALVITTAVHWAVVDVIGLLAIGVVVAAATHLATYRARRRRDPAPSLGLAILAGIVLVQRLATYAIAAASGAVVAPASRVAATVEIAALTLMAGALAVVSARALAHLRPDQTPAAAA